MRAGEAIAAGSGTATRALAGARWVGGGLLAQRLIQAGTVILLARLLAPADFGVAGAASLVLAVLARVKTLGLMTALVQRRDRVGEAADTAFVLGMATSCLLALGVVLGAPSLAGWFRDPSVVPLLRAIALVLPLEALGAVHQSLAMRDLRYRLQGLVSLAEAAAASAVAVSLALAGAGAWALAGGMLAGPAAASLFWWVLVPWRPGPGFHPDVARKLLGFGGLVTGVAVLDGVVDSLHRAVVGRVLGIPSLGQFDMARRATALPVNNLASIGQRVALPAFCREAGDVAVLRRWLLGMVHLASLGSAPAAGLLLVLADLLVPAVFGGKWVPAVPLVRLLAPTLFLLPLAQTWPTYLAAGRAGLLLALQGGRLLTVPLVVLGALRGGLAGAGWAILGSTLLVAAANLWLVGKVTGFRGGEAVRALRAPVGAALVATAAAGATRAILAGWASGSPWTLMAASLAAAGLTWLAALRLGAPEDLTGLARLAARSWRGSDNPPEEG